MAATQRTQTGRAVHNSLSVHTTIQTSDDLLSVTDIPRACGDWADSRREDVSACFPPAKQRVAHLRVAVSVCAHLSSLAKAKISKVFQPHELKFEMISCCHHVLGVFKYSPKCFVVRSALRCFRELPSSLLKF